MNPQSRSTSFSTSVPQIPNQRAARRPSVSSRFSYAVSIAEQGEAQTAQGVAAQHQIEEEIAKIKRYEVSYCSFACSRDSGSRCDATGSVVCGY